VEVFVLDARTGTRFDLQLPIVIRQENSVEGHRAVTQDMSAAAVLISANLPFEVGTRVSFEITFPAPIIGAPDDVQIECDGRVVRNSRQGEERTLACVIDRYRFVRPQGSGEAAW
jgi:hypothetical protein